MAQQNPQHDPSANPDVEALGFRRRLLAALGPRQIVELFVLANLAFLALDILLAHGVNRFAHWAEWVPLGFSVAAVAALMVAITMGGLAPASGVARGLGVCVGWCSVLVGVSGLVLHLNSQFFGQWTLKSLVYTAPFVAPLAYAGLGLLLILNRMVPSDSKEWAWWVVLMTWGGFVGNFILSLADHAQNGFFVSTEWIAVGASAMAVGFLLMPLAFANDPKFLRICYVLMAVEIVVGLLGFYYHVRANLAAPSPRLLDNFLFGAPAFAPLLFANLALLGIIGLWAMERSAAARPAAES